MGRVLAFDFGTKRTGMAVTDEGKKIAFPLQTEPTYKIFDFITKYQKDNAIDRFVVGEPKRLNNTATHATKYVEEFVVKLKKQFPDIPIDRIDERFTSSLAMQSMIDSGLKKKQRQNKETVDTTSATIILQSWIERRDIKNYEN
jgi:putative pre-16S rRNA nuclease